MLSPDVVAALQCDETQALYILFAIGRSLHGLSAGKMLKKSLGFPRNSNPERNIPGVQTLAFSNGGHLRLSGTHVPVPRHALM